jgi:hypothetical protein
MAAPSSGSQHPVLPRDFPSSISVPKYAIGDRVRFSPDYGIVTGLQYAPAEHLQDWAWRYTLWLDPQSPRHAWTLSDVAWEADLQLLTPSPNDVLIRQEAP